MDASFPVCNDIDHLFSHSWVHNIPVEAMGIVYMEKY